MDERCENKYAYDCVNHMSFHQTIDLMVKITLIDLNFEDTNVSVPFKFPSFKSPRLKLYNYRTRIHKGGLKHLLSGSLVRGTLLKSPTDWTI